jgi:hypothetical protein
MLDESARSAALAPNHDGFYLGRGVVFSGDVRRSRFALIEAF